MKGVPIHKGQAFVELAFGMFALALLLSATFAFIEYMVKSLDAQRTLRAEAGKSAINSFGLSSSFVNKSVSDTVSVEELAARYIFNSKIIPVKEEVYLPVMGGILQ